MGSGSENTTDDDNKSREDDSGFPAEVVAGQTNWFSSQTVPADIVLEIFLTYPTTTWPITSPTNSALETRVLTVEVYSLGYSALRRTLVMVLKRRHVSASLRNCERYSHQIVLESIADQSKAASKLWHKMNEMFVSLHGLIRESNVTHNGK